jgi:hypothetical protein
VSRNLWDESGLKVDSALTDVGWGVGGTFHRVFLKPGQFPTPFRLYSIFKYILTSSRIGELVMWDNQDHPESVSRALFLFSLPFYRFVRSRPWCFTPPLSSLHAYTYRDAYLPISSFIVDVSSMYDTTHTSFLSIKSKLTSKIHPKTEHREKTNVICSNSLTFYIKYRRLSLLHWRCRMHTRQR